MLPRRIPRPFHARWIAPLAILAAGCASSGASVRAADGSQREALTTEAASLAEGEKALGGRRASATLAVLPFESADTTLDDFAAGFAELITADLGKFPQLRLLERVRLDDVLREQGLDSARVDPATAVRVGRLIAAQQLVRGTVSSEGDTLLRFDVSLVDVGTSQLTAAYTGEARSDAIFAAERLVVARLAKALGVEVPPDLDARMASRSSYAPEAFRAFARGARQESDGDLTAAAASYEKAAVIAPTFDVASAKSVTTKQRAGDRAKSAAPRRPRRVPRPPARTPSTRPPEARVQERGIPVVRVP